MHTHTMEINIYIYKIIKKNQVVTYVHVIINPNQATQINNTYTGVELPGDWNSRAEKWFIKAVDWW